MMGIFTPDQWARDVHVIGLGGIGSWLVTFLVQQGISRIHLYDDDIVEEHNLGAQCFRASDARGKLHKATALVEYARRQEVASELIPHIMRIGPDTRHRDVKFSGVVISGVDSMESRAQIWRLVKRNGLVELYMDGRIGGKMLHLYTLNPSSPRQIARYEPWMFHDVDASQDPCAVRDDNDAALVLGSLIKHNLASFARGEPTSDILHGNLAAVAVSGRQTSVVRSL